MRPLRASSLVVSIVGAVACAVPLSPESEADVSVEDEALYTTTVVTFAEDGTQQVRTFTQTAAEHEAEIAAREDFIAGVPPVHGALDEGDVGNAREPIMIDSCGSDSLWIYDTNNTTGNRLCYIGAGRVDVRTVVHDCISDPIDHHAICRYWDSSARSIWAGSSDGWMRATYWDSASETVRSRWYTFEPWLRVNPLPRATALHDLWQLNSD
jgi:hypothetical protein